MSRISPVRTTFIEGPVLGAACRLRAVGRLAVEPVLHHIQVEAAHLHGAEAVEPCW